MNRGDLAWVDADKRRPAIILRVSDDQVTVIYGTGTVRLEWGHVCVQPNSRAGKVLKLSKPTYFYVRNVLLVPRTMVATCGSCPLRVFMELEAALLGTGDC